MHRHCCFLHPCLPSSNQPLNSPSPRLHSAHREPQEDRFHDIAQPFKKQSWLQCYLCVCVWACVCVGGGTWFSRSICFCCLSSLWVECISCALFRYSYPPPHELKLFKLNKSIEVYCKPPLPIFFSCTSDLSDELRHRWPSGS